MSKREDKRDDKSVHAMTKPETLAVGIFLAAISLLTWLLTLWRPFAGGLVVGSLILGVLITAGRPSSDGGDP